MLEIRIYTVLVLKFTIVFFLLREAGRDVVEQHHQQYKSARLAVYAVSACISLIKASLHGIWIHYKF